MRESFFETLLAGIAGRIRDLARGLKDRVWGFLRGKSKVSHQAVMKILRSFDKPYLEALGTAMETVTGKAATPEALARFLIGDVTLSNRLYRQSRQTASEVQRILRDHVKYAHDARKLALDLYEGYNFREREVLVPKVRLPKYLNDAALNGRVDALLARIQASQLKTAPLRAAYVQALDQILKESGEKAIERALETAVQERYRYFANRIAVTELARAHMDQIAREMMDDREVEIVQVVMSATHPAFDVCDLFAKQNKYGLGPGCYPKALAPKPIYHPWCRCSLLPRRDLTGTPIGPERPEAAQVYLRSLDPREAARVAGSRAKREEILKGASPESVFNAGRPKAYRISTVGDVVGSPSMRSEELAALAGDLTPVDLGPVHNRARDEVVRKGKATGKEHGVAVLGDGTTVSFGGDYENRIDVPSFDASPGSVTIHHNHPSGDSFSRADIHLLLVRPDISRVDAHGHVGGWASCERVGDAVSKAGSIALVQDAASRANMLTNKAVSRGVIDEATAGAGLWQVVMASLLESQGAIRYALNSETVKALAKKVLAGETNQ